MPGLKGRVVGQHWYTPYAFMLPGLLCYAAMFAWPAVIAIQLAFSDYDIVHPVRFSGWTTSSSSGTTRESGSRCGTPCCSS